MPRRLNILQTCCSASWGGLEMQALEITRRLHDRGHRLWLASPEQSRLFRETTHFPFTAYPLNVTGYFHPRLQWTLSRFLHSEAIDIVHCQHSRDLATVIPAHHLSRCHCPVLLSKRVGSYIQKHDILHRYTYGRLDRVLAISNVIHRYVVATTPIAPEKVLTLHDAVDLSQFNPASVDRQAVRASLGIPPGMLLFGFVGRFSPGKGHEELLDAAALLVKKGRTFHLGVAGEASHGEEQYATEIRARAHTLNLDANVTFLGYRADIPAVMSAFDVLVFPSHAESFGVVLIEGMAMERPVVATNCDGVVDIVVDGETGIMVPPKDAKRLAEGMDALLQDPSLRVRMGAAGRKRVMDLFDQEKQIGRIEALYYQLLGLEPVTA
jgi:glycosyltransferase involved in cell wall biosynthesis